MIRIMRYALTVTQAAVSFGLPDERAMRRLWPMPGKERTSMAVGPSPTVRRRRLGIELRRLREAAGLTCEQVGERLDYSGTRISRIETGRLGVRPNGVRELLDVYGVTDEATREALIALARDARKKGWWRSYRDVLPPWFESYVGLE